MTVDLAEGWRAHSTKLAMYPTGQRGGLHCKLPHALQVSALRLQGTAFWLLVPCFGNELMLSMGLGVGGYSFWGKRGLSA